ALLILACASLIGATAQRMGRLIDRVRLVGRDYDQLVAESDPQVVDAFFEQVQRHTVRARLLQWVLTVLYLGLSLLIATSVALGVENAMGRPNAWPPVISGLLAVICLLSAAI